MENQVLAKEVLEGKINVPFWFAFVRWYKVSCMPKDGQAIVYVSSNKKVGVFTNVSNNRCDWYVEKYPIVSWCYSAHLLPKTLRNNI